MAQTTLTKMEDFALMSLMKDRLEASGMSATEFAEFARKELDNPKINKDHLYYRAKELGLKLPERVAKGDLEARVMALEAAQRASAETIHGLLVVTAELKTQMAAILLAAKHNSRG